MKKRISYKEWTELGQYNYAAKWLRPFCSYYLTKESAVCFRREQRVSWFLYLLIFIPVHLLQLLWCLWDGGVVAFEINKPYLGSDPLFHNSEPYNRAKKVWNSKS